MEINKIINSIKQRIILTLNIVRTKQMMQDCFCQVTKTSTGFTVFGDKKQQSMPLEELLTTKIVEFSTKDGIAKLRTKMKYKGDIIVITQTQGDKPQIKNSSKINPIILKEITNSYGTNIPILDRLKL